MNTEKKVELIMNTKSNKYIYLNIFTTEKLQPVAESFSKIFTLCNIIVTINIRPITNTDIDFCIKNGNYLLIFSPQTLLQTDKNVYPPYLKRLPVNKYFLYQFEDMSITSYKIKNNNIFRLIQNSVCTFESSLNNIEYYPKSLQNKILIFIHYSSDNKNNFYSGLNNNHFKRVFSIEIINKLRNNYIKSIDDYLIDSNPNSIYFPTPVPKRKTVNNPEDKTIINSTTIKLDDNQIFKNYLLINNIEQIYISKSLMHLKYQLCKQYNLKIYNDISKPCIFFGSYSSIDFDTINYHKSFTYIMIGGTDVNNLKKINIKPNTKIISISKDIKERLNKNDVKNEYLNLNVYIYKENILHSNKYLWTEFCNINKISKVYIINLKRRFDRLIMMKFKLEQMGIYNYEIVEAVDGYTDKNKILYQKYKDNVMLNNNLFYDKPQVNSEGAYGLLLTYRKLLYNIENNKNIIIFEDDIVFHKNFYENLFKYDSNFFLTNDIIYLGANQSRWNEEIESSITNYNYYNVCKKKYYWNYGTYSMILTPKIINLIKIKLDDMLSYDLLTIDILLWHIITNNNNNIRSKILYPNVIIPQLKESDNMGPRDIELLADGKKWTIVDYDFLDITSDFKTIYDSIILNKLSLRQNDIQIDKCITNSDISRLIENKNKSFVFIIPSFNNEKYYIKNLESVFNQKYTFWRAIYIDDCSTDNTYNLVKEYIKERGFEDKVLVLRSEKNMKQAYSRYIAYNMCQDDEICCLLDGDDWIYDDNVLNVLNEKYIEHNLLISYGQFYYFENDTLNNLSGFGIYKEDEKKNINFNYRNKWITQHLRTCETSLLKTIPESYLKFNGDWLKCCTDKAEMWWVLERSNGRHMNIGSPTYVYNKDNSVQHDNSYYNMEKDLEWKKYREGVEYYLRNYKHIN